MDKNGWHPSETKIYSLEEIRAARERRGSDHVDMVLLSIYLFGAACWIFAVCA
jgi:hypothetical protein